MDRMKKYSPKRFGMMMMGNLLIGTGVAFYRMSGFGVDAFSCMNLGISGFLGMSFGNWQLMVNTMMLIVVWFTKRDCIGPGTIVNMVGVGYTADFLLWLCVEQAGVQVTMPLRILCLLTGTLFAALGCAFYMAADMGIAPYDSTPLIITKYAGEKISFRAARVIADVTAIVIAIVFCLLGRGNIWTIVGLGTILNACCSGPLIQFFRGRIDQKGFGLAMEKERQ